MSCDSKHRSLFANAYSNTHGFINYGMCKFVHRINIFEIKITLKLGSLDQDSSRQFSMEITIFIEFNVFFQLISNMKIYPKIHLHVGNDRLSHTLHLFHQQISHFCNLHRFLHLRSVCIFLLIKKRIQILNFEMKSNT